MGSQWYYVCARLGHQGAGRFLDIGVFIWANNPIEVLKKYKRIGGLKRSNIPDITPLSSEEASGLEKRILDKGLSLKIARKRWYIQPKEYTQ